jgi:hypothetical protein
MIHDLITDAETVLAQVAKARKHKKHRIIGFDIYYRLLLEDGFLPGNTALFPNRALTRELHLDMQTRIPDLRFTAQNKVGVYFGQEHFQELGITLWRHETGNGWAFPRLVNLRRDWERRYDGWEWPNELADWIWNPLKIGAASRSND